MVERLLQYVWQHRLYGKESMVTNDGLPIRIIDPGQLNSDAGPDFFNAKVEIDGKIWAGNIEIHLRASDWKRHGHHTDKAYDSVILHVVEKDDAPVFRSNGEHIPQMILSCSPLFEQRYTSLITAKNEVPCETQIKNVSSLTITEWIQALAFERLQQKADRLHELYETFCGSWEDVCYVTLARNFGFGLNNDAFERLARRSPLRLLHKHSDSLFQIEALLFGQAGMLSDDTINDDYYRRLRTEYAFLANKFSLIPLESHVWKMFRIRPQNFPHRRIAMLAQLIYGGFNLFSDICAARDEDALRELFTIRLTGYWANHFSFGSPSPSDMPALSNRSIDVILINTVAPLFYARGEIVGDETLSDRAVELLEQLRPESNSIVEQFKHAGIKCPDALTSQALIQLRREYCEARKCIFCKIGHKLLSDAAKNP